MKITILGLSITSSWGNGHATTYRGLVRELSRRGHEVTFLERDQPWYADNRDLPEPPFCRTIVYDGLEALLREHRAPVADADAVIVGSYVPDGIAVGEWVQGTARGVTAFYDIDTPVTLARLASGDIEYLTPALVRGYDLYLSFTGGPTLTRIERELGSPCARPLYCSVDPDLYRRVETPERWALGYLGTYSRDRQPTLERLLVEPARRWREGRFIVAGPQYPSDVKWPPNVEREVHLAPAQHAAFYSAQAFTLNVTRADMVRAGWSPSVRLFEAAACGTPILSDWWDGLDAFFQPGREILVSRSPEDTLRQIREIPGAERRAIGERARAKVLSAHTAAHRAAELEQWLADAVR